MNAIGFGLRVRASSGLVTAAVLAALLAGGAAAAPPPLQLHIVGGLGSLNQFTRHEQPFWETELARLSGGRYTAEIVPFDRAGIRSQEVLTLVQLGAVPFATLPVSGGITKDPELTAPGPGRAESGHGVDAALGGRLQAVSRRHDARSLRHRGAGAVCLSGPGGLLQEAVHGPEGPVAGMRVRTSGPGAGRLDRGAGRQGRSPPASATSCPYLSRDELDCAVTGTMSGNTVGLDEVTTHIHPMAISWGLSIFAANGAAWNALPADLRALLKRELPRVEREIWDESERDTADGIACNIGAPACKAGKPGHMIEVPTSPADERLRREIFASTVLPRWLQRCGPQCAAVWNRTLAHSAGIEAR